MKFNRILFMTIACSIFSISQQIFASGCAWYEKFEIGKEFPDRKMSAEIKCRDYNEDMLLCSLILSDPEVPSFIGQWVQVSQKPEEGFISEISMKTSEVMRWEDCDGGDSPPPYKTNGMLYRTLVHGITFEKFVAYPH